MKMSKRERRAYNLGKKTDISKDIKTDFTKESYQEFIDRRLKR